MEDGAHMGIPHDTVNKLQNEVISVADDLIDFNKSTIYQIADNLRCPVGRITDPNPEASLGAKTTTPPFVFWSKSHNLLVLSAKILRYYETFGRPNSAANVQWNPVMNKLS